MIIALIFVLIAGVLIRKPAVAFTVVDSQKARVTLDTNSVAVDDLADDGDGLVRRTCPATLGCSSHEAPREIEVVVSLTIACHHLDGVPLPAAQHDWGNGFWNAIYAARPPIATPDSDVASDSQTVASEGPVLAIVTAAPTSSLSV